MDSRENTREPLGSVASSYLPDLRWFQVIKID